MWSPLGEKNKVTEWGKKKNHKGGSGTMKKSTLSKKKCFEGGVGSWWSDENVVEGGHAIQNLKGRTQRECRGAVRRGKQPPSKKGGKNLKPRPTPKKKNWKPTDRRGQEMQHVPRP